MRKVKIHVALEEARAKLRDLEKISFGDWEAAHTQADDILCELLTLFGCDDIVQLYDKIKKHYA